MANIWDLLHGGQNAANEVLAGPASGVSGPLTIRTLVAGDDIIAEYIQSISTTPGSPIGFNGAPNTLIKVTAGSGGVSIPLPTAVGISGQIVRVIQIDTGVGGVSFTTQSSQTINGSSTLPVLTNQWQTISLESDNANWIVIATAN